MSQSPRSGRFPRINYEYDAGTDTHTVKCDCGARCATTEPLVARRFVQTEAGRHARGRIFKPEPEVEP